MKSIRQLLRQPLKTLTGVLLIAAAVAVLCVGMGQGFASLKTQKYFEQMFTTTAVTTIDYQFFTVATERGHSSKFDRHLPEDAFMWMEKLAAEHPELVKTVSKPGLASAYIPELVPSNYTQYMRPDMNGHYFRNVAIQSLGASPEGMPYSCAVLEITLTELGEAKNFGTEDDPYITMEVVGTIESVVGLQEGFKDPTGYTARLTLVLSDMDEVDNLGLIIGERYLVYGMNYFDEHWDLVSTFSHNYNDGVYLEDLDHTQWRVFTEEIWENYEIPDPNSVGTYLLDDRYIYLYEYHLKEYRTVTMTLNDLGADYDGTDRQEGLAEKEYRERYTVPTIARLDGTVEEFLASEDGALWCEMLENLAVNSHAFPVIGVQHVMSWVTAFARDKAEIVAGRDFTQDELDSGAKVCVISNVLAQENGLAVGDTITPQFYNYDPHSPYQKTVEEDYNITQPGAYFYTSYTPIVASESYTIIGTYEQDAIWQASYAGAYFAGEEDHLYNFTPNTIFVPENSVPSDMAYGTQGFFYTLILENGMMEAVKMLETQAGYSGLLSYSDQGYAEVSKGLFDYVSAAQLAFKTGTVVYLVAMLLFLMLYPGRETKTLMTMHSLGAARGAEIAHIFGGSFTILLAGTILGLAGGGILWRRLTTLIPASKEVAAAYGLDMTVLLGICVAQLLLMGMLISMLALYMSRKRSGLRKDR